MKLILASGSPRRRELMAQAGYDFDVLEPSAAAECGICSDGGPAALVSELAVRKATDVRARLADDMAAVLLAADTVVECDGQIFGKPQNEDHAREMLVRLAGQRHRVYTGVCVWPTDHSQPLVEVDVTTLTMESLTDEQIDDYLKTGLWQGKAGGFGYQDHLGWVHVAEGSASNVVGLPMQRVAHMLAQVGFANEKW